MRFARHTWLAISRKTMKGSARPRFFQSSRFTGDLAVYDDVGDSVAAKTVPSVETSGDFACRV